MPRSVYVPPDPGSSGGDYYETLYTEAEVKELVAAVDQIWEKVAHRIKHYRQGSFEVDRNKLLALKSARDKLLGKV